MSKLFTNVFPVIGFWLAGSLTAQAQFGTVYVSSASVHHIESNQRLGTNYKTQREAPQGYFSARGTAEYLNPSDAQHVNGYVKHIPTAINQSYTFQVGSGTDLRQLSVSGSRLGNAAIGTAWIKGNPTTTPDPTNTNAVHDIGSVTGAIASVSPVGQWDWVDLSPSQTAAGGVNVSVSLPDMTFFADVPNLRLVGWNGSAWMDLSGGAFASGNTENSTLFGTIPTGVVIQAIAIGSVATPLPVRLIEFTAKHVENAVQLQWKTAIEMNFSHYEIERSLNAKQFKKIGEVKGRGAHTSYTYEDGTALRGTTYYYRLRLVDTDQTAGYSPVRSTRSQGETIIAVYPNPTADYLTITGVKAGHTVSIKDGLGKEIRSVVSDTDESLSMDFRMLTPAMYYVTVSDPHTGVDTTQKVIKK